MTDLQIRDEQTFAEYLKANIQNGTNLSVRGTAKMAGVDHAAMVRSFNLSGDKKPSKLAKSLMEQGFDGGDFIGFSTNGIPPKAVILILEYYAYDAGARCKEQAKQLVRTFGTIGIMSLIEEVTKPKPEPVVEPVKSGREQIKEDLEIYKEIESIDNPILKAYFTQSFSEVVGVKLLNSGNTIERLVVVTVRANELGYPASVVNKYRSQLGKYVAARIQSTGKVPLGAYQVKAYKPTEELDDCIRNFFKTLPIK